MAALHYSVAIAAPKQLVWDTMLQLETYKLWAGVFHPGSYYAGSWDKGSEIKFISTADGGQSGILGKIVENIPQQYVSIEIVAEIKNGQSDTSSKDAQQWIGSRESYRFTEQDGLTTVDVELVGDGINPEIQEMFAGMWPRGLQKLKELCEQNS